MGRTVRRSRRREGHALFSSTATDPGNGISPSPGSWRRSLRHRSSAPARNSHSVEGSDDSPPRHLERHEQVETVARLLQLERTMAADIAHRLQRERAPSSAAKVHEDLLCPDTYHPEYEGNEHTYSFKYNREGPPCQGCEAVWKNEPFYGNTCRCCFLSADKSCRCRRDGPFKFPGTLIKSPPHPQYIPGIAPPTPTAVSSPKPFPDTPSLGLPPRSILFVSSPLFVNSRGEVQHHRSLEAQQGLKPLVRGCGAIRKADAAEMPKELKTIVSEDVVVTVDDYEVYGFPHGNNDVPPHTDTLEDTPISYLPIPIDGGGQPIPSQGVQSVSREQSDNCYEGAMQEARNMGSPAVKDQGILNTPPHPRLTSSSPSFCFRRSDAPPSFSPSRHDDGILPNPQFSTRLPPHSYLRRSGSCPRRSGPSQTASSKPLSRATPSILGVHPLSFSPLPSPSHPLPPPSPQQPPILASPPLRSPLLPSLPSLFA